MLGQWIGYFSKGFHSGIESFIKLYEVEVSIDSQTELHTTNYKDKVCDYLNEKC